MHIYIYSFIIYICLCKYLFALFALFSLFSLFSLWGQGAPRARALSWGQSLILGAALALGAPCPPREKREKGQKREKREMTEKRAKRDLYKYIRI